MNQIKSREQIAGEGIAARSDGATASQNPYPEGTDAYNIWAAAWLCGTPEMEAA